MANEAPPADFDAVDRMHGSLGFTLYDRANNIIDIDLQRNGKRKWLQADAKQPGVYTLNKEFALTPDEKDVLKLSAMWRLLGSREDLEAYFETKLTRRSLTDAERKFLDRNRPLFERFLNQATGLLFQPAETLQSALEQQQTATVWLQAHGIPVSADPAKAVQQYRAMIVCAFDQATADLFDRDFVNRKLTMLGRQPKESHTANVTEMCANTLHDDPYRPIALSEYTHMVVHFEAADRAEAALMRGVGAVRQLATPTAEVFAELKALGLPTGGDRTEQWRRLFTHMYDFATRDFLTEWIGRFGFSLHELKRDGTEQEVRPETLPKRILFSLLGEFSAGDIVCQTNPGVAVSLTPFQQMIEYINTEGLTLVSRERASTFALFPTFCHHKTATVVKGGELASLAAKLKVAALLAQTPMSLLDNLLDGGYYATLKLSSGQRKRVARVLGFQHSEGRRFETEFRARLLPELVRFNGAFLKSWLDQHDPFNSKIVGVEQLLQHYVYVNVCRAGVSAADANHPNFPSTGEPTVDQALEAVRIDAAGGTGVVDVGPDDQYLAAACASMHVQPRSSQEVVEPKKPRQVTRAELAAAALCGMHSFYIRPEALESEEKRQLLGRLESTLLYEGITPVSNLDDDIRFEETKLWLESMVSTEVVRALLRLRILPDPVPRAANREALLAALAQSNLDRFRIVKAWARNLHRGMLCWHDGEELQRKLETLQVRTDNLSAKQRAYYFMGILYSFLSDRLVSQFLTAADRKSMLSAEKDITFSECYAKYCSRYNAGDEIVQLAVGFKGRLITRLLVRITEQDKLKLGPEGSSPECKEMGHRATAVGADARRVELAVPTTEDVKILQLLEDGTIDEFTVDAEDGTVKRTQHYENQTLPALVSYMTANGFCLIAVDGVEVEHSRCAT